MSALVWDAVGSRYFETGISNGVLYTRAENGTYSGGVVWNGLSGVTESPSGAEPTPIWADNIKYLNMMSNEEFAATIEAYTYPDEFAIYDGSAELVDGVMIGQQTRGVFGFSYKTRIGNDSEGDAHGYKIHLVYGCSASPSEKSYATVNDNPEAIAFSWEITTVPVAVTGKRPTAHLTIDSRTADATQLAAFELILYGTTGVDPRMPLPDEVLTLMTPVPEG